MPRVLYHRRIRPSRDSNPPSSPVSTAHGDSTPLTPITTRSSSPATQQVVLDGPNSPSSPLLDPNHELWSESDSDSDQYRPDTPEQDWVDSFDYAEDADFEAFAYLRNCDEFANSALEHYNNQEKDGIKYELVKSIISWRVMDEGSYYHVNFTAKSTLEEKSEEEFFFAEVLYDCDVGGWVPTCIVSMDEDEGVGGLQVSVDGGADPRRCYYCGEVVKHPMDGSLFEAGHIESTG